MQLLNLKKDKIDITKIKNARFLYNSNNKELILDDDKNLDGSHAELYYNIKNTNKNFDNYIRGWIGFGGRYKNGIIHFAPPIDKNNYEDINAGIDFIEQMIKLGVSDKVKIRNFGYMGEIRYSDLISNDVLHENYQDNRSEKEKFNSWFYGSKIIDNHKQPLSVYKLNENTYTSNKWLAQIQNKGKINKSFLRIENPYIVKNKLTENIEKIKQQGFDGIIENENYIIFDNFQVKDLEEANAQNDNKIRNALEDVFDEILYNIKEGEYTNVNSTILGFGLSFIISNIIKKYFPTFQNKKIYMLITELSDDKIAFYENNSDNLGGIFMHILPDELLNKLATYHNNNDELKLKKVIQNELSAYFSYNKEAFIHELTHVIDFTRLKNYKNKQIIQYNLSNEEYLSNPLEFNAWFNAKIAQYDNMLQLIPEFKNSWKEFYDYIINEFDFITQYNTKYRRKFDKRLYQYWKENINKNHKLNEEIVKAYHGGQKGIKTFKLKNTEYGMFFFTNSKDLAKSYIGYNDSNLDNQQLYEVELNINKPLDLRNKESLKLFAKSIHSNMPSLEKEWLENEEKYWEDNIKNNHDIAWYLGNLTILHREEIKKYAINNNYDAILTYEPTPDGRFNENWQGYIVFNPKQIKILQKDIVESLQKIETLDTPIYITNSIYDVLNLTNKIPSMRVLIDESKNLYIIGNAMYFIHSSLFDEAIKAGYYEFSSKEEKDLYWETLPAIIIDQNNHFWLDRKNDYFEEMLNYGKFVVYYRTDDFLNTNFYKVLNTKFKLKNKQNLNEEVYTVYHGSSQSFDVFSYDFIGKGNDEKGPGFYFTSNKDDAKMYGNVGEFKITLDKLVSTKRKASINIIEKIIALSENCKTINELVEKYENDEDLWWESNLSDYAEEPYSAIQVAIDLARSQPNEYKTFLDLWSGVYRYNNKKFLQTMVQLGYDGIIFNVQDNTTHYIVFNPNKIKKVKNIVTEGKVISSDYGKFIINPNYEQCANIINNYNFDLRVLYDPQINVMVMGNANTTLHWYMFLFLWQQGMYPDFGNITKDINKASDAIQDYYDYKTCQFVLSKDYTDDWNNESSKDDLNAYDDYIIGEDFITYFRSRNKTLLSKTRLWDNIVKHSISPELLVANESSNLFESVYNTVLDNPFAFLPKNEESIKKVKKFIQINGNKYQNNQLKFYHATNANYDIENQGLLPTSQTRRNSYQSGSGYVYLANSPEQAQEFADLAFPRNDIAIYEVDVYFNQMLPDKDQIRNQRLHTGKEDIKDTLANSIVYGGGIRVKGKIPPYQIKLLKTIKRKSIGKLMD